MVLVLRRKLGSWFSPRAEELEVELDVSGEEARYVQADRVHVPKSPKRRRVGLSLSI